MDGGSLVSQGGYYADERDRHLNPTKKELAAANRAGRETAIGRVIVRAIEGMDIYNFQTREKRKGA